MTEQMAGALGLDTLLSNTSDGFFVLDRNRRYVLFNAACERITGYPATDVIGGECKCADVTDCRDRQSRDLSGAICPGLAIFNGRSPEARQHIGITTKDGQKKWVETIYTPVLRHAGDVELIIGVMRDVTEARQREDEWHRSAKALREEVEHLRAHMRERYGFSGIISRSPRMQVVLEKIHAACTNASPVLILGEDGTGKEMVARTIHYNSLQKDGPFISLSCSSGSREGVERELFGYARGSFAGASQDYPGLFVAADGGSLFLDDVTALNHGTQERLLRAMQTRSVRSQGHTQETPADVRLIAAAGHPVQEIVAARLLREDLFYRLSVLTIEIPPLRTRKEDLPFLVDHFLGHLNQQSTRQVQEIEPGVWSALAGHDWPGNVRELQNVIETAHAGGKGETLSAESVSYAIHDGSRRRMDPSPMKVAPLDETLHDVERRAILAALRRANGQRSLAAKLMSISRSRLYRRMDALGIAPREEIL